MRDLYEKEKDELRAQNEGVGEQLVKAIDDIARLHAELSSARTVERKDLHEQIERLRRGVADVAAQARLCAGMCGARPAMVAWMKSEVTAVENAALSQPAATGEGA
jgi:hypothetical protein